MVIRCARIIDPLSKTETVGDLVIENGVITGVFEAGRGGPGEIIDAAGMAAAPGLIDAHVHFREPGFTWKEDIASGAKAAARGGFTTVICMANTSPAVDNPETLRVVLSAAAKTDIRVLTVAAISKGLRGMELTDMVRLRELGAVGFSDDGAAVTDAGLLYRAMLTARELGAVISLHEEDPALVLRAGLDEGAPAVAESSMTARDCALALETGARVHIQHVSSARTVDIIRSAKALGARVTAEVTPQHFSLTRDAALTKGTLAKVNPPLRSESDRQSLIAALREGVIDIIASDHAPHSAEEKARPPEDAPSGMIGLETSLALGITKLVREGYLTLPELIGKMTLAPARLYGLDSGRLEPGQRADIVIFDDNERFTVERFASKSSNSPFIGEKLYGKVKYTICGGRIVYKDG